MRVKILLVFVIFCSACVLSKKNQLEGSEMNNEQSNVIEFVKSKDYQYSVYKQDIPQIFMDQLRAVNNDQFKIGDVLDTGKISFSDASLGGYEFNRRLNFVLFRDSTCLVCYTQGGGIGTYDVIDFMQYNRKLTHEHYETAEIISDTVKLYNYLSSNPKVEHLE